MKRTLTWFALVPFVGAGALAVAQDVAPTDGASPESPSTTTGGLSSRFNPSISANLLVVGGASTRDDDEPDEGSGEGLLDPHAADDHGHGLEHLETGIHLQEVELRFSAVADPFVRADVTLAAHEDEIGFEEAYLSTLSIPRVTIRAGRMFAAFGKHNLLHTHAFPFLTAPLPARALLGPEGLRGDGVSFDVLLPTPFFAEVTGQAFGDGEFAPMGEPQRPQDLRYVGHLKTLFDLGAPTTLEVGGSYLGGRTDVGTRGDVVGADVTLKWSPLAAQRYRGVAWHSEFVWRDRNDPAGDAEAGLWSGVQVKVARRWWVQGMGAVVGLEGPEVVRGEGLVGFVPSEYTAFRLQYAAEAPESDGIVHEVFLQAIVSIGSHPAHAY